MLLGLRLELGLRDGEVRGEGLREVARHSDRPRYLLRLRPGLEHCLELRLYLREGDGGEGRAVEGM